MFNFGTSKDNKDKESASNPFATTSTKSGVGSGLFNNLSNQQSIFGGTENTGENKLSSALVTSSIFGGLKSPGIFNNTDKKEDGVDKGIADDRKKETLENNLLQNKQENTVNNIEPQKTHSTFFSDFGKSETPKMLKPTEINTDDPSESQCSKVRESVFSFGNSNKEHGTQNWFESKDQVPPNEVDSSLKESKVLEKSLLEGSGKFDFDNNFKKITDSSRIDPSVPVLNSGVFEPNLKKVVSEYSETIALGTENESPLRLPEDEHTNMCFDSQGPHLESQMSSHFGKTSAIAPVHRATKSSSLWASNFPSADSEPKKDEKLKMTIFSPEEKKESFKADHPVKQESKVETEKLKKNGGIEVIKEEKTENSPGKRVVLSRENNLAGKETREVTHETKNEASQEERVLPEATAEAGKDDLQRKVEIPLDSFMIPRHFPQLLLFTRWAEISTRILDEIFELSPEDLQTPPVQGLECLFSSSPEGKINAVKDPSQGAILRMMFESSCSLQVSLSAKRPWPLSLVGPVVEYISPKQAPWFVSKVMEQWVSNVFTSDPKLLWEDGTGKKVLTAYKSCPLTQSEEDFSKLLFHTEKPFEVNQYLEDIQPITAVLKPQRLKKYSLSAKIGNQSLVSNLRISRLSVTVDNLVDALNQRQIQLLRTCEAYCNTLHEQFSEIRDVLACQDAHDKMPIASSFISSKEASDLFEFNCKAFDFGVSRDQFLIYSRETSKILTGNENVCQLDAERSSCVKLFRTYRDRQVTVFFVNIVDGSTGKQAFDQSVIVPRESLGEFSLDHVIKFALTECFLQSEESSTSKFEEFMDMSQYRVVIDGNTVSRSDIGNSLATLLGEGNEQNTVTYIDIVQPKSSLKLSKIEERGIKLEFPPLIEADCLSSKFEQETIMLLIDAKTGTDKKESQLSFLLPPTLNGYSRVSAFEPINSRVIAKVKHLDEWKEVDYSPCGVQYKKEEDITLEKGYWTCAIYQKPSWRNSKNQD